MEKKGILETMKFNEVEKLYISSDGVAFKSENLVKNHCKVQYGEKREKELTYKKVEKSDLIEVENKEKVKAAENELPLNNENVEKENEVDELSIDKEKTGQEVYETEEYSIHKKSNKSKK